MKTQGQPEAVVLSSLTHLMVQWSSLALQAQFVHDVGVAIDPIDIQPLYVLGLGGPRRASDLAADLRLSRPTMSKQLARLATAGLITRHPDPDDGRATIIALSDSGARAYAALVDSGLEMVHQVMADWQPDERRQLADLVQRFVATASAVPSTSGGYPAGKPPTVANPAIVPE